MAKPLLAALGLLLAAVPLSGSPLAPCPPGDVTLEVDASNATAKLTWEAPRCLFGGPTAGYRIYRIDHDGDRETIAEVGPDARSLTIGFCDQQWHDIEIRAFNRFGESRAPPTVTDVAPPGVIVECFVDPIHGR